MNFNDLGKILLVGGLILALTGLLIVFFGKFIDLSKIPLNYSYKKDNYSFNFPLGLSIIISVILTVLLNLFFLFRK